METTATSMFRKTTETFRAGARTLPQRYFIAPEVFAEEMEAIFSAEWICVGHQSQIDGAGDYFLSEMAGESVIVLRDHKKTIRAFYNVCRHRGTRLCQDGAGHLAAIQCPYHAWTYGLDGKLIGAPQMDDAPDFDKADYSLGMLKLALWEGFIFVNVSNTSLPLEDVFRPIAGKFSDWNLPQLRSAKRIEYEVRANWKLIFQNYSECYHCPGVHPMLSKVSPYDSAENDLTEGPFLGGFMSIAKGASLTMSAKACARGVSDTKTEDDARVFYYSIFPNMLLSLHPDYVMVHRLRPQPTDRTLIECDWFFHPAAGEASGYNPEDAIEFWDITNKQDWHVCELSQLGISSRAYRPGPYSPPESIPAAWDREYLRHLS